MGANTKIEWTNQTWNPLAGCSPVSEGCRNCYAAKEAVRLAGNPNEKISGKYEGTAEMRGAGDKRRAVFTGRVNLAEDVLEQPSRWRKPRLVFVNSMSDLFHESVPDEFIARVFGVMRLASEHTFQVLTKRPERMADFLSGCRDWEGWITHNGAPPGAYHRPECDGPNEGIVVGDRDNWPLPNVWLGTSVENQGAADERIPHLLRTPAAVCFLSCEPLLGPVNLTEWIGAIDHCGSCGAEHPYRTSDEDECPSCRDDNCLITTWGAAEAERLRTGERWQPDCPDVDGPWQDLHWVITGGESGPNARPMHPDWARSLRDQCQAAGVAFFFKQWGEYLPSGQTPSPDPNDPLRTPGLSERNLVRFDDGATSMRVGKAFAGRELDGRTWDEMPEVAHVPA
jgi:protein gp37